MTQEELAKSVGITQGAVSQWELGLTHPSIKYLKLLANALDITLDELIDGELAS